jgi:hypothetical protein
VIDGDNTVVTGSALALSEEEDRVERWWLDLKDYNKTNINKKHKNMFEVGELINFIEDRVSGSEKTSYDYLATESPNFINENRLVLQLHSPLDLFVTLSDGEVVGSSTPNVRNVSYNRYGELQYLSISEDEANFTVQLQGVATGSFTLDLEQYQGNDLLERGTYNAIPSGASTKVELSLHSVSDTDYELRLDYEGDGTIDQVYKLNEAAVAEKSVPAGSKTSSKRRMLSRPEPMATLAETSLVQLTVGREYVEIVTLAKEVVRLLAVLVEYNKVK